MSVIVQPEVDWPVGLDAEPSWPDPKREPDWLAPPPEPDWPEPDSSAPTPADAWPDPEPGALVTPDILDCPPGTPGPLLCGCDAAEVLRLGDHGSDCRRIT